MLSNNLFLFDNFAFRHIERHPTIAFGFVHPLSGWQRLKDPKKTSVSFNL